MHIFEIFLWNLFQFLVVRYFLFLLVESFELKRKEAELAYIVTKFILFY